jgi:hypothetical protein
MMGQDSRISWRKRVASPNIGSASKYRAPMQGPVSRPVHGTSRRKKGVRWLWSSRGPKPRIQKPNAHGFARLSLNQGRTHNFVSKRKPKKSASRDRESALNDCVVVCSAHQRCDNQVKLLETDRLASAAWAMLSSFFSLQCSTRSWPSRNNTISGCAS